MFHSTTALMDYTASAQACEGIPDDGTLGEVFQALEADFTWITDVQLQMDGSALGVEGSPSTPEQAQAFVVFAEDLYARSEAALFELLLDDEAEKLILHLFLP